MMSINLVVLIFASLIIQDAVSSEQQVIKEAATPLHTDGDKRASAVPANDQHQRPENEGKIWNWTFGSAGAFPRTTTTNDESKPELKKEQASSKLTTVVTDADDSNASASGFKKSFLRKAHLSNETKPHPSIPLRNLEKLKDEMRKNSKAHSVERESNFDDFSDSFDSRDLSFDDDYDSQSYGSSQFDDDDDDDDLSDNEYFGRLPHASRTGGAHQNYPTSFSTSTAQVSHPASLPPTGKSRPTVPVQRPAMQVRSVGMQPRSLQMRGSPVRSGWGRYGRHKDSIGM